MFLLDLRKLTRFAIKNDIVYIIEANPRASRTVPFISKAYDEPYVNFATKLMLDEMKIKDFNEDLGGKIIILNEFDVESKKVEDKIKFIVNEGRDRKSTRLNSSHIPLSRMPSSA